MAFALSRRVPLQAVLEQGRQGEAGLRAVVEGCLDRMDAHEPHVRALLPEPDRRRRILSANCSPFAPGRPLQGLLLGVKDMIAAEGFPTRCGSVVPPEVHQLPAEADVVRKLREAGAIVAGKTVLTEFAHRDPGATANPWDPAHTPGGSSSGSAAAVASGMVHIALATQTVGSVGRPASFCGICGYKPSYGRVSRVGVVVYSPSIDTVGFYTPDAAGMHLVASSAVEQWDPGRASATASLPVLGVPEGAYLRSFSKEALAAFEEALADLVHSGVEVRRVPHVMEDFSDISKRHVDMTRAEWARSLTAQWNGYASMFRSKSAMEMALGLSTSEEAVQAGQDGRGRLRAELENVMDSAGIDVWVTPGALQGSAPAGLDNTGDPAAQLPWSHSGLPTLAIPAGFNMQTEHPLPLGLQLAAKFGRDEELLAWGAKLEQFGISDAPRLA